MKIYEIVLLSDQDTGPFRAVAACLILCRLLHKGINCVLVVRVASAVFLAYKQIPFWEIAVKSADPGIGCDQIFHIVGELCHMADRSVIVLFRSVRMGIERSHFQAVKGERIDLGLCPLQVHIRQVSINLQRTLPILPDLSRALP